MESSRDGIEITLVHLANHTSGLPFEPGNVKDGKEHPFDPYSPYRNYDTDRLYDYLAHQMTVQSTPGEKRTYSNLGFGLLGNILTLISGKPYGRTSLRDGLYSTWNDEHICHAQRRAHAIYGPGRDPRGQLLPWDVGGCGALTGAGGMKSSVKDLVKYLRANMLDTTYFYLAQQTTKRFDEHFTGKSWAGYLQRSRQESCGRVRRNRRIHIGSHF